MWRLSRDAKSRQRSMCLFVSISGCWHSHTHINTFTVLWLVPSQTLDPRIEKRRSWGLRYSASAKCIHSYLSSNTVHFVCVCVCAYFQGTIYMFIFLIVTADDEWVCMCPALFVCPSESAGCNFLSWYLQRYVYLSLGGFSTPVTMKDDVPIQPIFTLAVKYISVFSVCSSHLPICFTL